VVETATDLLPRARQRLGAKRRRARQPFPPLRLGARGAFDRVDQDVEAERLGDVSVTAGIPRGLAEILIGRRRHENDRECMAHRRDLRRQLDPGVAVQIQIGNEAGRLVEVGRIAKRLNALEDFSRKPVPFKPRWIAVSTLESSSTIMIFFMSCLSRTRCYSGCRCGQRCRGGDGYERTSAAVLSTSANRLRSCAIASPARSPGLRKGRGVAAPVSGRECRVRPILRRMGLLLAPLPAGASFPGAPSGSAGLSRRHAR